LGIAPFLFTASQPTHLARRSFAQPRTKFVTVSWRSRLGDSTRIEAKRSGPVDDFLL
jgi:hypothetical protein